MLFQFDVTDGRLNCSWTQRSVDVFLGLPFNISSYALLTCLVAKVTGLIPGKLVFNGGDTHLYTNHIEQVKEQMARRPFPLSRLVIKKELTSLADMEQLTFQDLELVGYQHHPHIKGEMAI